MEEAVDRRWCHPEVKQIKEKPSDRQSEVGGREDVEGSVKEGDRGKQGLVVSLQSVITRQTGRFQKCLASGGKGKRTDLERMEKEAEA